MRVNSLPQAILAKLFELDDRAARLAAEADRAEAALKEARYILSSDFKPTSMADRERGELYEKTRSGFDAVLKAAPAARTRATAAVAELNRLKAWISGLPDGTQLEPAPKVVLDGQSFPAVRQRLASIAAAIGKLLAAAVDPRQRIEAQVDEWRRAATPDITEAGEVRLPELDFSIWARSMAAYLHRDLLVDRYVEQYEAQWGKQLTQAQRAERLAALERERDELWWVEAALIAADPQADGDPGIPAEILLGVTVASDVRDERLAS